MDVTADTLALAGLHSSFPGLTLAVPLTGEIRMEGTIADAATHMDLTELGGGGNVQLDGQLTLLAPPWGARDLTLTARDVDLRTWLDGAPHSRLTFTATGLPPGLSIDAATGVISGTISVSADLDTPYTVTVTATHGASLSDSSRERRQAVCSPSSAKSRNS